MPRESAPDGSSQAHGGGNGDAQVQSAGFGSTRKGRGEKEKMVLPHRKEFQHSKGVWSSVFRPKPTAVLETSEGVPITINASIEKTYENASRNVSVLPCLISPKAQRKATTSS